jgi:HK97 family phage major capsid protein
MIPDDYVQRDMTAAGVSGSNYVVGTELSFASALYANSIVAKLPMRRASLTGNGLMAITTTTPTSTWLNAEDAVIADASMVFGQRSATPKNVATTCFVSKQMDLTAPAVIAYVEQMMAAKLAQDIDAAFVNGSGASGQPAGLLTIAGTTTQSGTTLAYSGVCTMIAAAEGYGGVPHVLLGKDTAKLLRQRAKVTSGTTIFDGGTIDGLPAIVSRAVPDDALLVFDPALITEVRFGPLEILASPLATPAAFARGAIGVRLIASVDFMVDNAAAVAKSTSIT